MDLAVRVRDRHLLNQLADHINEEGVILQAHRNVPVVHLVEAVEDLLRHIGVDRGVRLPRDSHLGEDDGHDVLTKVEHTLLVRETSEDANIRLVILVLLDCLIRHRDFLLGQRLEDHLLLESREVLRGRLGCGRRTGSRRRGDSGSRLGKTNIVGLDEAETVQDEVHTLRVLDQQLLHHRINAHVDTSLQVLLVSGGDDWAEIEVDGSRVVLLHVLLDVETSDVLGDGESALVDPARIVPNARECLDELSVDALRLRLEIAQVQVARASDEFLHLNEVLGEQLVTIVLSLVVRVRGERETERLRVHFLDDSENLGEVVEDHNLRLRQTVSTLGVEIHVLSVVEGANVEEHRTLRHLEMNLRVLKNELVAVLRVQHLRQRRLREGSRHTVNLAEHLVEERANRFLADPEVVVRVDSSVGRQTPLAVVVVRSNERAAKVLSRHDASVDLRVFGHFDGARNAEAHDTIVRLGQDRANSVDDVESRILERRNDHIGRLVLEHTAVLRLEVLLHFLVGVVRQGGADVVCDA